MSILPSSSWVKTMKCKGQKIRFINKNSNENERRLMESWWSEATQLYGTSVSYFVHNYTLSGHDFIYGEQPTAPFSAPIEMLVLAQLNNDSLLLSKFGIQTDADLTIVIPIKSFAEYFNHPLAQPKAGDLIRLDEVGWDRPGGGGYPNTYPTSQLSGVPASAIEFCKLDDPDGDKTMDNSMVTGIYVPSLSSDYNPFDGWLRGPNVYEITERRDENIPGLMNPLMAHIVWYIKLKRFDYSSEPFAPREQGYNIVNDNTRYSKISGTPTIEPSKRYPQNSEDEAKKSWDFPNQIGFDYTGVGNRDSQYGGYGRGDDIVP